MTNITKSAISEVFLNLLEQRPLKHITILDITKESGLNRNTFYYHFKDIPDLIEYILVEEWNECINKCSDKYDPGELACKITEQILKRKNAILHIYKSVKRESFEIYLWKACDYIASYFIENETDTEEKNDKDGCQLAYQYIKGTIFGIIMEWIESGLDDDFKDNIQKISILKSGNLYNLIKFCLS